MKYGPNQREGSNKCCVNKQKIKKYAKLVCQTKNLLTRNLQAWIFPIIHTSLADVGYQGAEQSEYLPTHVFSFYTVARMADSQCHLLIGNVILKGRKTAAETGSLWFMVWDTVHYLYWDHRYWDTFNLDFRIQCVAKIKKNAVICVNGWVFYS